MADYAANYTYRYRVTYRSCLYVHKMTFRADKAGSGDSLEEFRETVGAFIDACIPLLAEDFAILQVDQAEKNSDVFLPAITPPVTAEPNDANEATLGNTPRFISLSGKSSTGSASRVFVYGVSAAAFTELTPIGQDYRFPFGENINMTAIINAYNSIRSLNAPDDTNVVYGARYVNMGLNSYLQRKARG